MLPLNNHVPESVYRNIPVYINTVNTWTSRGCPLAQQVKVPAETINNFSLAVHVGDATKSPSHS